MALEQETLEVLQEIRDLLRESNKRLTEITFPVYVQPVPPDSFPSGPGFTSPEVT